MNNKKPVRIAVLGSTRGTDLVALINAQQAGQLKGAEIVTVISNNPKAYILERAQQANLEAVAIPSKGKSRYEFEIELLRVLQTRKIDLILLIGFMRILTETIINAYPNKILNIHPSLLPKYSGGMNMDVHAEVLKNGDAKTGCTLHYVSAEVDAGPILLQEEVVVLPDDTPETLKERVQIAEQVALLKGIEQFVKSQ
ncbi:MAG: phosphoribosylglycinamide formyltransferase [bacterium]|nr:phosphoribosylglycinamide formyltransferase [bacterium]